MIKRKRLKYILILCAAFWLVSTVWTQQIPLPGKNIRQFVDELPFLHILPDPGGEFTLHLKEFQTNILPAGTVAGYTGTWVWGYLTTAQKNGQDPIPSYIGPVIAAQRHDSTQIRFENELGMASSSNVLAWVNATDQTMHWADPLGAYPEENDCAHKLFTMQFPLDANGRSYPPNGDRCAQNYDGPIPAVVHLHGGEVPPVLDGGPDAWVTSVGNYSGHGYYTVGIDQGDPASDNSFTYNYPNSQEAANIWFHDHVLGITRLNVYAGMAGAYIIQDPANDPIGLPTGRAGEPLIPLVIQDRMFDTTGQLFFPADSAGGVLWSVNPEHPYWVPEFEGDAIVVNGKTWPKVTLSAKRYRFLFLNGSNARTYALFLVDAATGANGPPMYVIGTDGGYLDAPVKIDPNANANSKLILMPGERYDVIIDFTNFANTSLIMRNTARTPYPKGVTPNGRTIGRILRFNVGAAVADSSFNPEPTPGNIALLPGPTAGSTRTPMVRLADPVAGTVAAGVAIHKTRLLTLNEVMGAPVTVTNDPVTNAPVAYPGGPLGALLNNTRWDGMQLNQTTKAAQQIAGTEAFPSGLVDYYYSELPTEGETELWEIVNLTGDAHPIHLHLVQFQVMNRQNFNFNKYNKFYASQFPGGVLIEEYGPPYSYSTPLNPNANGKLGGNPDVTPYLQGALRPPLPQEAGWKDTVISYPAQVLRLVVRWAPTDLPNNTLPASAYFPFDPNGGHGYVWHCHIIDHEDNEMMRPTSVIPRSVTRTYVKGVDY